MNPDDLPGWVRCLLEPCVLGLLAQAETYGYDLAGQLESIGFGKVQGGTLYPLLLRLERQGLLKSKWRAGDGGPGRKYYALGRAGRRALEEHAERWQQIAPAIAALLSADGARR